MAVDYNEILLNAMDTVIAQRLSELQFDKTIICTITSTDKADKGIYQVSDGSTSFEAQSDNTKYTDNTRVYVTIPMNDWSNKKQIIGKYTDKEDKPIALVTPLEQVANLSGNLITGVYESSVAANYNPDKPKTQDAYIKYFAGIDDLEGRSSAIYDTLCIRADFKCLLENYTMQSGAYGLIISIEGSKASTSFRLDSNKDMFGNPYAFNDWMSQEQAYSIKDLGELNTLTIGLYQDGNFVYLDDNNKEQPVSFEDGANASNIYVNLKEIYLGTAITGIEDNTVKIFTQDNLNYSPTDIDRNLSLVWYNKGEGDKWIGFTDGTFSEKALSEKEDKNDSNNYYQIEWLIDNINGTLTSKEIGKNEILNFDCIPEITMTEVQAIVWLNGTPYKSNILQFHNQEIKSNTVLGKDITLKIINEDNAQDSYPYYGEGTSLARNNEIAKKRVLGLEWEWSRGELDVEYWKGSTIIWKIPKNNSMIKPYGDNFVEGANGEYYEYEINNFSGDKLPTCSYKINEYYQENFSQNTIVCEITVPENKAYGNVIIASKTLHFDVSGTSGTDYTLIVRPKDGHYITKLNTPIEFYAELYDTKGQKVENAQIDCDWWPSRKSEVLDLTVVQIKDPKTYSVIKATTYAAWTGKHTRLTTYTPVIYSAADPRGLFTSNAPSKIIYDSFGTLKMNSSFGLELYVGNQHVGHESVKWKLYPENTNNLFPKIVEHKLVIPPYYCGIDTNFVLCAEDTAVPPKVLYSIPLIIQQYQYDSEVLNDWDGSLIIDNKKNRIMSAAGVFGRKDTNNTFSGVVLGSVTDIIGNVNNGNKTGIIGYRQGVQTYGFRDDGTAFIGGSGAGRIYFDGNGGTISSAKYNGNTGYKSGAKIDLQSGALIMEGSSGQYFKFNKDNSGKLEMKINGADIKLSDNEDASLTSYISATASEIRSEVASKASYACTCQTGDGDNPKWIRFMGSDYEKISEGISKGLIITIHFTQNNTKTTSGLKFRLCNESTMLNTGKDYSVTDSPTWRAKETLAFVFDGTQFVPTTISKSFISQTAEEIKTWVGDQNYSTISQTEEKISAAVKGSTDTFSWSLDANGFYLNNSATANSNNFKFKCNKDGVEVNGTITGSSITGSTINNGNGTFEVKKDGTVTCKNINITGGTISVGSDFSVNDKGTVTCNNLFVSGGQLCQWQIDSNGMWSGKKDGDYWYYMHLMSTGTTYYLYKVGQSEPKKDWRFLLGKQSTEGFKYPPEVNTYNFGIDREGALYATKANIFNANGSYKLNLSSNGTLKYNRGTGTYTGPYLQLYVSSEDGDSGGTHCAYLTALGIIIAGGADGQPGEDSAMVTWEKLGYLAH